MAENVRKTKYEIMIDVMQALGVSSFDLHEVEKYVRKIGAKADDRGTYEGSSCKAVVDHFKLVKEISKSDKAMITSLRRQVKDLQEQNKQLTAELVILNHIKADVKSIKADLIKRSDKAKPTNEHQEKPTYTSVSGARMNNYPYEPTNNATESRSQHQQIHPTTIN